MAQKLIKQLNGHSGCKVYLLQKQTPPKHKTFLENSILVQKISSDINYNFRLKKQLKKQSLFKANNNVYSPKIFECGYLDNLFYFNMEFIQGKTLAEYTTDIKITEIADFIRCLFASLYMENKEKSPLANKIFLTKIEKLEEGLDKFKELKYAFKILKKFDWSFVYKSPCHGDLTLENILITNDKKLYLIDFLDSFYNSWMIDVAKLLQDLELKWSFRKQEISANRSLRLEIAKEALIEEILQKQNGEKILNSIYVILLLNIIRIYPYSKDEETIDYLNNSCEHLIRKIDSKSRGAVI